MRYDDGPAVWSRFGQIGDHGTVFIFYVPLAEQLFHRGDPPGSRSGGVGGDCEFAAILAQDDGTLTGNIVYPVCQVANPEATEAESAATQALLAFLQTDYCLQAFEEYCFIVNK